jgi:hypothetical protein
MKLHVIVRIAAASLVGVLNSWFVAHDYAKWRALGREAFLTFQSHRFDDYIAAPSSGTSLITGILAVAAIAAYEGLVALVTTLLSRRSQT